MMFLKKIETFLINLISKLFQIPKKELSVFKSLIILLILLFFLVLAINFSFPDLFAMFYVPSLFFEGNIYSQVIEKKISCAWLDATYPPLYYLFFGFYMTIVKYLKLIPNSLFTANLCPIFQLISNQQFLFWVKLPLLFFHFASAVVFQKIVSNKNHYLNFLLWLLNPLVIFVTFIQGQYEIIPVFFILLALLKFKEKNFSLSFLSLGIGGALKHFPFLLLPVFILCLPNKKIRNPKIILRLIFLTFIPYLLSVIPFIDNSDMFLFLTKFSENTKMFDLTIALGKQNISVYLIAIATILLFLLNSTKKTFNTLVKYCFLIVIIYFLTTHWFVQRIVFLLPFLLILSKRVPKLIKFSSILNIFYFVYVLISFPEIFDYSLTRPFLFNFLYSYKSIISFNGSFIQTVVNSLIYAVLLFLSYLVINHKFQILKNKEIKISYKQVIFHLIGLFFYLFYIISPFQFNLIFLN